MNKKRTIATLVSMIIGINTIPITGVNAKVIEPEIVKTETWTTSYYIDDDMETLYPYIDCQADIYNDGTVKVYFWNTHEWDGFATVNHTVTIINSKPVRSDSIEYALKNGNECIINTTRTGYAISKDNYESGAPYIKDYSFWENIDISYYPKAYIFNERLNDFYQNSNYDTQRYKFYLTDVYPNGSISAFYSNLYHYNYFGALPKLKIDNRATLIFSPNEDPTGTYEFHILGHDITITPDILSSSIVAQPQLTAQDKYIKELEEKIQKLENESGSGQTSNSFGDIDGNDIIDGRDATMLLTYYAKTSIGYVGSLEDFIKEQNGE